MSAHREMIEEYGCCDYCGTWGPDNTPAIEEVCEEVIEPMRAG